MKKISFYFSFLVILIFVSCQGSKNLEPTQESIDKAKQFTQATISKKSKDGKSKGFNYIIPETLVSDIGMLKSAEIVMSHHRYRNDNINGIENSENNINEIIKKQSEGKLNLTSQIELMMWSYSTLDFYIFDQKIDNTSIVVDILNYLLEYSNPVEWEILSKCLVISEKELKGQNNFESTKTELRQRINSFKNDYEYTDYLSQDKMQELHEKADIALKILDTLE